MSVVAEATDHSASLRCASRSSAPTAASRALARLLRSLRSRPRGFGLGFVRVNLRQFGARAAAVSSAATSRGDGLVAFRGSLGGVASRARQLGLKRRERVPRLLSIGQRGVSVLERLLGVHGESFRLLLLLRERFLLLLELRRESLDFCSAALPLRLSFFAAASCVALTRLSSFSAVFFSATAAAFSCSATRNFPSKCAALSRAFSRSFRTLSIWARCCLGAADADLSSLARRDASARASRTSPATLASSAARFSAASFASNAARRESSRAALAAETSARTASDSALAAATARTIVAAGRVSPPKRRVRRDRLRLSARRVRSLGTTHHRRLRRGFDLCGELRDSRLGEARARFASAASASAAATSPRYRRRGDRRVFSLATKRLLRGRRQTFDVAFHVRLLGLEFGDAFAKKRRGRVGGVLGRPRVPVSDGASFRRDVSSARWVRASTSSSSEGRGRSAAAAAIAPRLRLGRGIRVRDGNLRRGGRGRGRRYRRRWRFCLFPRATRRARTTGGGRGGIGKRTSGTMALASSSASSANDPAPSMGSGRRSRALAASCSAGVETPLKRSDALTRSGTRRGGGRARRGSARASNASSAFARATLATTCGRVKNVRRCVWACACGCKSRPESDIAMATAKGPYPRFIFLPHRYPARHVEVRSAGCGRQRRRARCPRTRRGRVDARRRDRAGARGADVRPFFARGSADGSEKALGLERDHDSRGAGPVNATLPPPDRRFAPSPPPPPASEFPAYVPRDFFRFELVHQSRRSAARGAHPHGPRRHRDPRVRGGRHERARSRLSRTRPSPRRAST